MSESIVDDQESVTNINTMFLKKFSLVIQQSI